MSWGNLNPETTETFGGKVKSQLFKCPNPHDGHHDGQDSGPSPPRQELGCQD